VIDQPRVGREAFHLASTGHGKFVDTAGSANPPGKLETTVLLTPGRYSMLYDLAGNNRDRNAHALTVRLGASTFTENLPGDAPWSTHAFPGVLTLTTDASVTISFHMPNGFGFRGLLLDNVFLCKLDDRCAFEDDFEAEPIPAGQTHVYNHASFQHWTVASGYVDLYAPGDPDFPVGFPSTGKFVDLSGSVPSDTTPGLLQTTIHLQAGTWRLHYDMAGNNRHGTSDQITVTFGSQSSTTTVLRTMPWTHQTSAAITLTAPTSVTVSFQMANAGSMSGIVIDNVQVCTL
jgi:hypothetical protein